MKSSWQILAICSIDKCRNMCLVQIRERKYSNTFFGPEWTYKSNKIANWDQKTKQKPSSHLLYTHQRENWIDFIFSNLSFYLLRKFLMYCIFLHKLLEPKGWFWSCTSVFSNKMSKKFWYSVKTLEFRCKWREVLKQGNTTGG